ncbi:hypothetical protein [Kamptonema formosum]|uniref:hypothetical protein n=1 Tax=Kamptonema formosum TaxID=331992 RepID=UPI00047649C8|nr:hypothetical protein [Oscillatoria sp. PCC 10802]
MATLSAKTLLAIGCATLVCRRTAGFPRRHPRCGPPSRVRVLGEAILLATAAQAARQRHAPSPLSFGPYYNFSLRIEAQSTQQRLFVAPDSQSPQPLEPAATGCHHRITG